MRLHIQCFNLEVRWQVNVYQPEMAEHCLLYLYLRNGVHLRSWRLSLTPQYRDGSDRSLIYMKEVNAVRAQWRVRGPIVREL